jgi:hypothetical protein
MEEQSKNSYDSGTDRHLCKRSEDATRRTGIVSALINMYFQTNKEGYSAEKGQGYILEEYHVKEPYKS